MFVMLSLLDSELVDDNVMKSDDSLDFKNKLLENLGFSFGKESFVEILLNDIPLDVKKHFEGCSMSFIFPEDYKKGNFEKIGYVKHNFPTSYMTYFAIQDKEYDDGSVEKLIYLFEKDNIGNKIGHGEIRLCLYCNDPVVYQAFFKDKPFVGFAKTEKSFLKKGYGILRLIHMNKIVNTEFNLKLHTRSSGFVKGTGSRRNREKLVEYGLATSSLDNNGNTRLSFI